jgi:hypothetical protein
LIVGFDSGKRGQVVFWDRRSHRATVLAAAVPKSTHYRFTYLKLDRKQGGAAQRA